jgi:hypothetical protein
VDVYSNGKLVASTFKDYASLTLFTPYDGEVMLWTKFLVVRERTSRLVL